MGASEFQCTSFAKDAATAFNQAVADAQHRYGHEGYTGSIAEKSSYVVFDLPRGVSVVKALGWAGLMARGAMDREEATGTWLKDDQKVALMRSARRTEGKVPPKHRDLARALARVSDDKWGPALCLEVKGVALERWRAKSGMKGKRGRLFVFTGMASE